MSNNEEIYRLNNNFQTRQNIYVANVQREMASTDSVGGYETDRFKNEVDIKLKCSVCLKVLKDPVQCPNEHYFCRSCIKENLRHNAKTCPVCKHPVTEETLTKPPRILTEWLESLVIRCNYENRGCQEVIRLEFLDRHVKSCGYSPTRCTNTGCAEIINRDEKKRHEHELCQFRKIVCDECGEQVIWKSSRLHPCFMRKEMDDLARRLDVVQNDMGEVKHEVGEVKHEVGEVKHEVMKQVKLTQDEMAYLTREATERCDLFTGRRKIFVCGGNDSKACFNSAESYSWHDNTWTLEPAMNEKRSQHSAFVHDREIYVSGGWTGPKCTDSVESLNIDEKNSEWKPQSTIPIKCNGQKMVCHEKNVIQTGGREGDNVSDEIYEISLSPPHNTKLLTKMPEPRCYHGCEIIENQVVVTGGGISNYIDDAKNTVYAYDLDNNELKTLPPLPFAVSHMDTVSYKGNIILIGGVNEKCQTLNTVVMYDVKTGKIEMLPCLNHKRAHCAAVITGNVIVVMGGYVYETKTDLNSVECLDLNTNVWRELSPMTTKRTGLAAVLKPIS